MHFNQIIELIVILIIIYGFFVGIKLGVVSKVADLLVLVFNLVSSFYLSKWLSPIVSSMINITDVSFMLSGTDIKSFLSAVLAAHLVNILVLVVIYIITYIILSYVVLFIRKLVNYNKPKFVHRFLGGIWGAVSNAVFAACLLSTLVPLVGMTSYVKQTVVSNILYNTANFGFNLFAKKDSTNTDITYPPEVSMIQTISGNSLTPSEASYLNTALQFYIVQMDNNDAFDEYFLIFKDNPYISIDDELYDEESIENFQYIYNYYFEVIAGSLLIAKTTGKTSSVPLKEAMISLYSNLINYLVLSPYIDTYYSTYSDQNLITSVSNNLSLFSIDSSSFLSFCHVDN